MAGAWAGPRGSAPIITMSRLETVVTASNDDMKLLELQTEVRKNFIITGKAPNKVYFLWKDLWNQGCKYDRNNETF